MATLYITEFPAGAAASMQVVRWPKVAKQTVAIGASAAQSQPFNGDTRLIRVDVDATCSIDIGPNPTADTSDARLCQNQVEYYEVLPGQRLSVIANT